MDLNDENEDDDKDDRTFVNYSELWIHQCDFFSVLIPMLFVYRLLPDTYSRLLPN